MLTLRIASPLDAPALTRLNAEFNGTGEPPERLAERLGAPGQVEIAILADLDGHITGFAGLRLVQSLFYPTPQAELTELYVEPAYRRCGVARALVAFVENLAKQAGVEELVLMTGFENRGAQAFYQVMGFKRSELAMRKSLVVPSRREE